MIKKLLPLFTMASLLVLVFGCIAPAPPKPGKAVIKISVQPVYSLYIMSQKYTPLVKYLSGETGYDVRLVSAISYDSYLPSLEANQVHVGIQNPLAYITLVKTRGAYPLVSMTEPDGSTSYRGVIITRQGSGIKRVEDLRGKEVAVASRSAVGGFLGQALVCKQNGVDVDSELYLSLVGSQDAVIYAVYQGKTAAGFVREDALPLFKESIDLTKLNIIANTDYFPTWCVAAFRNTTPEMSTKVTQALLNLDWEKSGDREILEAIGTNGFIQASDSDYNIMRKLMDALNIPY
jgi:phosphonate transport system substrate-binding protein